MFFSSNNKAILLSLVWTAEFPQNGQSNRIGPLTHLSLEEVAVRAGHKVLMDVDDKILLIVGIPQGNLDQQLMPHPIHFLNIIFITLNICIKLYIITFLNCV